MEAPSIRLWRDCDSVAELTELLHRAYARWRERGVMFVAVDQDEEKTRGRLRDSHTFIAVQNDEIVGAISLYPGLRDYSPEYYSRKGVWFFGQFAVEPTLQGSGLGQRLLAAAEEQARAGGATELACDTRNGAPELVAYYERRGYRQVAKHSWPFTEEHSIVLAKKL